MAPHEQDVRAVHDTWIDAVNRGDLSALLTLMTDDAVFLAPGMAPMARDGFSTNFSGAHDRILLRCTSEIEEIVVAGDVAFTRCLDSLSLRPRTGGDATRLAGHRLTVYRRQPDGRWLLARDAHTLTPVEQ